jgi:hypothetical protein
MKWESAATSQLATCGWVAHLLVVGAIIAALAPAVAAAADDPYAGTEGTARPQAGCLAAAAPYAGMTCLQRLGMPFTVWIPAGWKISPGDAYLDAVTITPGDPAGAARFAIYASEADGEPGPDNLVSRRQWFDTLLHSLPNIQVQSEERWRDGETLGFDARYTYFDSDPSLVTRRAVRLLYSGSRQYYLVAEAPAGADFERLQPAFTAMMLTFKAQ